MANTQLYNVQLKKWSFVPTSNYNGTNSVILMALVDVNYKFILISVSAYGKQSDGGNLSESEIGRQLENNSLQIPINVYQFWKKETIVLV